jgi:arylsulfatase A-like enzyme
MPHLLEMERQGVVFPNYFVTDSLCCPSRSSIFTGQYPHNTQVLFNAGTRGGYGQFVRVGDTKKTFAVSLHKAGYRTAMMGKYLNGYPPTDKPPAGWDEWDVTGGEGYREFRYHLNENGHVHKYGRKASDYLTDVLSNRAVQFMNKSQGKPFLLEVATYAPHKPSTPAPIDQNTFPTARAPRGPSFGRLPKNAPPWLARYGPLSPVDVAALDKEYRLRVESVQAVDRMIGRLQRDLAARGLLRNTYFVFSSDNGYHMGQYRMLPGKQTAFDTDIRVPLVVTGPGVPAGRVDSSLASSIDLAPTFEQIAGARTTYPRDGVSLLDLWHGQPAPAEWRKAALIEHRSSRNRNDPDIQGSRSGLGPSYEALRFSNALYVEYFDGEKEYYDLSRDPLEMNNIVGTLTPQRLAQLHRMVVGLQSCRATDCRTRTLGI